MYTILGTCQVLSSRVLLREAQFSLVQTIKAKLLCEKDQIMACALTSASC
jgi:hypothetical protein